MKELNLKQVEGVSGGQISGYESAGAVLTVLGAGAALGPIGAPVMVGALAVAGGLAIAQFWADWSKVTEEHSQ